MKNTLATVWPRLYGVLQKIVETLVDALHRATSRLALKNVILFSSIPDFSESTVQVFDLMAEMDEFRGYRFIWFCDHPERQRAGKERRAVVKKRIGNPLFRLVNLYCESTAKCCIYTHQLLGNRYNEKQLRLCIAHGTFGIKKMPKSFYRQIDYSTRIIQTRSDKGKVVACGLPRNDRLFDDAGATRRKLGLEVYDRIIIWMPTFKHYQFKESFHMPRNDFIVPKENDITLQGDDAFYPEVDRILAERNMLLLIKYHHGQNMNYVSTRETANIKIITDDFLASADIPLYSLLGATDALITDFSSVCYDYLLLNRQIGFDITDLALYECKPGIKNPLDWMPGEKIGNTGGFCGFIANVADGADQYEEARKKLLNRLYVHHDGNSTKRVIEFILSELARLEKL